METDTHTHTDTQTKYSNPRCACAPRVNYTRVLHTGRLPLKFAYIVHSMYVLVELAFTYQTIVALSAKLNKATTKVHTGCHLPIYIPFFIGALPQIKEKYVEQVEKSFL